MIVDFEHRKIAKASTPANLWRGRSGALHPFVAEPLDSFGLDPSVLHVIAGGPLVLWVGSATDIVADASSRARFRLAMSCADRVFAVAAPTDEVARATMIWDLEGAEPCGALSAA